MTHSRREALCLLVHPVFFLNLYVLQFGGHLFRRIADKYDDGREAFICLSFDFDSDELVASCVKARSTQSMNTILRLSEMVARLFILVVSQFVDLCHTFFIIGYDFIHRNIVADRMHLLSYCIIVKVRVVVEYSCSVD